MRKRNLQGTDIQLTHPFVCPGCPACDFKVLLEQMEAGAMDKGSYGESMHAFPHPYPLLPSCLPKRPHSRDTNHDHLNIQPPNQPSFFLLLRLTGGLAEALPLELPRFGASKQSRCSEGFGGKEANVDRAVAGASSRLRQLGKLGMKKC